MTKAPVRFKRVAAVFHEAPPRRLCESSGSEHSPENSMDLFDLVNSFIERDNYSIIEDRDIEEVVQEEEEEGYECKNVSSNLEAMDRLRRLFGCEGDEVKRNVRVETEQSFRKVIGKSSSSTAGFKRRLMTRLRQRGFDAGLCKSKWEKIGRYPSGQYEYIDVIVGETRYIIEPSLAGEFEIARPTDRYTSLLSAFPPIFVGEVEELKQVVKTMCSAIKESMKAMELQIPPWRKHGYMQAKWFGSYKRTTNEAPDTKVSGDHVSELAGKRFVGFTPPLPVISCHCREDFGGKDGSKVGLLAAAFGDARSMLPLVNHA